MAFVAGRPPPAHAALHVLGHKGTYHTNEAKGTELPRARAWPCRATHPSRTTVAAARSTLSRRTLPGLSSPHALPIQERQLHHNPITCSTGQPSAPTPQDTHLTWDTGCHPGWGWGSKRNPQSPPRTQGCSARGRAESSWSCTGLPPAWGWESLLSVK